MKTEQDIKNQWMELSGLPIVSDDEKYAYVQWLENKYLDTLKNVESSSRIMQESDSERSYSESNMEDAFEQGNKYATERGCLSFYDWISEYDA